MKTNFEPCFCVDLGAFRTEDRDSGQANDSSTTNMNQSCAGKTLLIDGPAAVAAAADEAGIAIVGRTRAEAAS